MSLHSALVEGRPLVTQLWAISITLLLGETQSDSVYRGICNPALVFTCLHSSNETEAQKMSCKASQGSWELWREPNVNSESLYGSSDLHVHAEHSSRKAFSTQSILTETCWLRIPGLNSILPSS